MNNNLIHLLWGIDSFNKIMWAIKYNMKWFLIEKTHKESRLIFGVYLV